MKSNKKVWWAVLVVAICFAALLFAVVWPGLGYRLRIPPLMSCRNITITLKIPLCGSKRVIAWLRKLTLGGLPMIRAESLSHGSIRAFWS